MHGGQQPKDPCLTQTYIRGTLYYATQCQTHSQRHIEITEISDLAKDELNKHCGQYWFLVNGQHFRQKIKDPIKKQFLCIGFACLRSSLKPDHVEGCVFLH